MLWLINTSSLPLRWWYSALSFVCLWLYAHIKKDNILPSLLNFNTALYILKLKTNFVMRATVCIDVCKVDFRHGTWTPNVFPELSRQLAAKFDLPLKSAHNTTRGFYIQMPVKDSGEIPSEFVQVLLAILRFSWDLRWSLFSFSYLTNFYISVVKMNMCQDSLPTMLSRHANYEV